MSGSSKSVSTDALARHARPTLTTRLFAPSPLGMIFANPSYSEAGATVRIGPSGKDF
jgi:hypothetical protein